MNQEELKTLAKGLERFDSCHASRLSDLRELYLDNTERLFQYIKKGYQEDAVQVLNQLTSLFQVIQEQTPESMFNDIEKLTRKIII